MDERMINSRIPEQLYQSMVKYTKKEGYKIKIFIKEALEEKLRNEKYSLERSGRKHAINPLA